MFNINLQFRGIVLGGGLISYGIKIALYIENDPVMNILVFVFFVCIIHSTIANYPHTISKHRGNRFKNIKYTRCFYQMHFVL